MKTLTKAVAIASLVSASALTAQVANAEVEVSAGLATTYLWRGTDLGGAAFSAAADYSHDSGAYAGLWASSGDAGMGNEYDLYVGYAMEAGPVSVDVSVATYTYNRGTDSDTGADTLGSPGELSELIVGLGFADASLGYITNLDDTDYQYITLGYSVAGADISYSMSDDGAGAEYSHLDISYGLSDELAITVSKPFDNSSDAVVAAGDAVDEDTIVVLSYTLPIK
jgi:uncharacterized protein (TIGR02001 family)